MTKAIAIFFVVIHLTNVIGIYGIIARIEAIHQGQIAAQLAEDEYVGSDAITLKIPFSLPYSTHGENYERAYGKIEYEGQIYNMIKHKFHDNTLYIVCVKDVRQTKIDNALKDLAISMTDKHDGKSTGKTTVNVPIKDFEGCYTIQLSTTLIQLESLRLPEYTFSAIVNSGSPLDQPPRV